MARLATLLILSMALLTDSRAGAQSGAPMVTCIRPGGIYPCFVAPYRPAGGKIQYKTALWCVDPLAVGLFASHCRPFGAGFCGIVPQAPNYEIAYLCSTTTVKSIMAIGYGK